MPLLFVGGMLGAAWAPSAVRAQDVAAVPTAETPAPTSAASTPVDVVTSPAAPLAGVPAAICAKLQANGVFDPRDRADVVAFYHGRECRPLWVDDQGRTEAGNRVVAELGRAGEWGLDASDFKSAAVVPPASAGQSSAVHLANVELDITAAVLRYAHQAEGARIPDPTTQLSSYLDRRPTITPAADVLARFADAANPGDVLRGFQPPQKEFLRLKDLLARLRNEQTVQPSIPQIAARGPMLAKGNRNPDVATLKQRFDIPSTPEDAQLFDDALTAAIKNFQQSKDLYADGIVGPATRAALAGKSAGSTADKIKAVIANMEEWRWMPRDLGATHILVNVPAFTITLAHDGKTEFHERIVVGTAEKETPIFSKDMTTIVLNPRWNIPDSIKLSMLLSGRSIESQGYVVMRNGRRIDSTTVNWAKANLSAYQFYQPAGDDNALGLVKLLFPNKHSVYLHDTPSKYLFDKTVRLYSHGCMRVRNPQVLAQTIFDIDRGGSAPNVKQLIRRGPMDNQFAIEHPIPVHVGYFTVWVDADGQAHYYNDWYGHQKRITLALADKWDQIDVGRNHLAAVDTSALKRVKFTRARTDDFDTQPMGLTNSRPYRKYNGGVGDIIRQALGF